MVARVEPEILSVENSPYPLFIQPIPPSDRLLPELECRLVHQETGLQVPGQFTQAEARLIQAVTQKWDWRVDKHNKPACAGRLLWYLEQLCDSTSKQSSVAPVQSESPSERHLLPSASCP
ncbi:MAG: hypothetical protein ACRDEA_07765, partial [Microcystaceae cyanobacterium]